MHLSIAPDIDHALVYPSVAGSRRYLTSTVMRTLCHLKIFNSRTHAVSYIAPRGGKEGGESCVNNCLLSIPVRYNAFLIRIGIGIDKAASGYSQSPNHRRIPVL